MSIDAAADVGPAGPTLPGATEEEIAEALRDMIRAPEYPCVGAKSVVNRNTVEIAVMDRLADPVDTAILLDRLTGFLASGGDDGGFRSFIAAFRGPVPASEVEFEQLLWRQLDLLRDADGSPWDPSVSDDPSSPHFCFSVAGTAVFVIGMHPLASRLARRTPLPVLVFNPHAQFERLRSSGGYDRVRDVVRRRDTALQGSTNPMVADHGQGSEARQYSGRVVGDDWRAPLR
jgi:FPC/CPF motif-containing protein YcgG